MKIVNKRKGKKIAVMAAVVMGFMVIAFMPAASAAVTSFSVTPSSGVVGAVDSYTALVTTDGVTEIGITIPAGFIAVAPATGGVQIARVDFWNSSRPALDYYGYATITANKTNPTTKVDVYCKLRVGGDEVEKWTLNQDIDYTAGALNTFVSGFECDHSAATLKLPTEEDDGWINIAIDCTDCPCFSENWRLDDVSIDIGQFVRNPATAGDYDFIADGVTDTVSITAQIGCAAVFRNGWWYADTNGDHKTDIYIRYGIPGDKPVVGDIDNNGINDMVAFRDGGWYVSKEDHSGTDWTKSFVYGLAGDTPVIGDIDNDGVVDAVIFRNGWFYVSKADHTGTNWAKSFQYGGTGDIPVIGDIDNNGVVDVAVFRNGWFYVSKADHSGTDWTKSFQYGGTGDKPILDDIRNDGSIDTAVLRNGHWYVSKMDHSGTDYGFWYGSTGDVPIPHVFV